MTEHNNPPTFPLSFHVGQAIEPGLTMLDHFSGLAMQAAATNEKGADGFTFAERAEWAYHQADAMLKERQAWIK